LTGAFHQRAAVYLFGRRIPSARRRFFVWPAHLIAAPHPLSFAGAFAADPPIWCCCSAGASHRRATFSFVCRRICRQSTDLVLLFGRRILSPRRTLFRSAGAFTADPPIWCYFI
jgi:hypothetical protein